MANSIATVEKYLALLDEIYKKMALTEIFDAPSQFVRETAVAGTVLIPNISMQGLGDYGRNTGFVSGDVDFAWESHTLTQDRGRTFQVDAMDNLETFDLAFGRLNGEFIRTKVAPELDAYRIAKMAGLAGTTATPATLDKTTIDAALEVATVALDEAEVPKENRVILITPALASALRQSDLYVKNLNAVNGGGIDNRFSTYNGMTVVEVPQTRMYTAITLYDGSTAGQEDGGYIKDGHTGKDINFMVVHKPAVLGVKKHIKPRIFTPDVNQSADAYKFDYRIYHDLFVPGNKTKGIYLHNKA